MEKDNEKDTEKKSIKSRIVSAAWELFHDNGYNRTTVDDIIELSGLPKALFIIILIQKMNC